MKTIHIISHSHWDREWYMPFEYHRSYLIKLIDDCLELFENDKEFKSFHLDGHTALIEDYLEIKPQNEAKIKKYVREGKFNVGPWYVLQDEFLTSSEANIRNLLVGMSIAEKFGAVTKIGYFPDSFGNAGQMPQILKQAGMKAVAFGRGVKPTGLNNEVTDGYNSQFSELYWQSPDGSCLPAILFANWYNNGAEIPENADEEYWNRTISNTQKYASTDELLLMNGCDHQPVQKNLTKAIRTARKKYPEYTFIHSSFDEYVQALEKALPDDLTTVTGELTGQDTDGWYSLVNTCSANIDLKVMNRSGEILLEGVAEPLSAIAMCLGKEYPHDMLLYSWKTLMKNHPHDSICGCSCDAVNDEMRTRFIKSAQAAQTVIDDDLRYIAGRIEASGFEGCDAVFAVINTFGKERSKAVSVDVDVRRIYGSGKLHNSALDIENSMYKGGYELVDKNGNIIPCTAENPKLRFGYDLPENRFRQPYMAETVTVCFEAEDIPAMGYNVYGLKKSDKTHGCTLVHEMNTMENEYIRVEINFDGTLNLTDKRSGKVFKKLLRFEDVGDVGTEYTFVPAKNDIPILSGNAPAEITLTRDDEFLAEYKISVTMDIPKDADEAYRKEKMTFVEIKDRTSGRSAETVTIRITSYVSLEKHGKRVDVRTEFENNANNHRLRVMFPTGLKCNIHKAESVFEAALRNNRHKPTFTYPSCCEHQQGFVMMNDETAGMAVANIGLYEYEIVNDDTIAITLVRAVSEMGDWGVFPTELSKQQKKLSLNYAIVPFTNEDEAYTECKAFAAPVVSVQVLKNGNGFKNGGFVWTGKMLINTAFKAAHNSYDIIMRWVNYSDKEQLLTIHQTDWIDNIYMSNIIEEYKEPIKCSGGKWTISVKPFEIITVGCRKNIYQGEQYDETGI